MPDIRAPVDKEAAKKDYLKGMSYKELAEKYGVALNTIKSWVTRYAWNKKGAHTKNKRRCAQKSAPIKEPKHKPSIEIEINKLTEKQRLFAEIYVRSPIAYKAAIKAGYSPNSAFVEGSRLLTNVKVRVYVDYLKELKRQSIMLGVEDLVDLYMRIAFADMNDYMEFGQERTPVISDNGPIIYTDPATGRDEILTQMINAVKLKDSCEVDGSIISEIKSSRQGVSVKLEDRMKAMQWLTDYFNFNPENAYRREFDNKKLCLERERFDHVKVMDQSKVW